MRPLAEAVCLLLSHDVEIAWREFRDTFRLLNDRALAVLVVVLLLVLHVAVWSVGQDFVRLASRGADQADTLAELRPGVAFVMLLMTAQTLNSVTRSLYGRGDLDLLLSSPFPARIVLAVRGLSVALGASASAAIFVLPVADVGLLRGAWRSLALLPTLAAGALLAAAASLTLGMAMFTVLGPRRTRLSAQIVATFLGGGFMIWLQLSRFMHGRSILPGFLSHLVLPAWLGDLLMLPVRAAAGEAGNLLAWVALAAACYVFATLGLGRRFALGVVAATSVPHAPATRRAGTGVDRRFATRLGRCLRAKEWRLIRRDPWILSQLLLQILYMTPMLAMVWSGAGPGGPITLALAPMIVVVSYQVAASMTWLSLSGEDAPDLLASAPVRPRVLQFGKLLAVGQLTSMLAVLPLVWLATLSWRVAIVTALLATLAVCMAMVLSLWHTKPAKRSGFAARHRESKLLAMMEMVMSMLLGVTAAMVVIGSLWGWVPLAIALVILLVNRPRRGRPGRRAVTAAVSPDADATAAREPGQQPA